MYVITGGGSGIGRALAQQLAVRGHAVFIVGRQKKLLQEVASYSALISYVAADVATQAGRKIIVNALQNCSSIHGLIHCAAQILPISATQLLQEQEWQSLLNTNLNAPLFLTQALLEKLSGGRVLHMDTDMSELPVKGMAAYCTSKAGLLMLLRCWQKDLPDISIASVRPGVVDTALPRLVLEAEYVDDHLRSVLQQSYQEHLLIPPEIVASFLSWLLLDIDSEQYVSKLWDIRDPSHHSQWLTSAYVIQQPYVTPQEL